MAFAQWVKACIAFLSDETIFHKPSLFNLAGFN